MSFTLRLSLALVFVLGGVILALLSMASGAESRLDRYYPYLLGANFVLALAMAILTLLIVLRTYKRYRQRVFGSRLMVRLALAFTLMGIVPVTLVSLVSVQFLSRSIDSWFSQSVDGALESGAALGRATLEAIQIESVTQARRLALALESVPDQNLTEAIETLTEGRDGLEVLILNAKGRVLAIRSASLFRLVPDMPSAEALNRARATRQFVIVEPRPDGQQWALQARALVMSVRSGPSADQVRFVQWLEPVPDALARNIDALNLGYSDYRQLVLGKQGIRKIYGVTLSLALLLAVFGALSAAVLLSAWLAGPLRSLERATKAVAVGDYPQLKEDAADHELNDLLKSFNDMTRQLQEAKQLAFESQQKREASMQFLEQVLSHLSAGVMVFDQNWQLRQFNPGASRILGEDLRTRIGQPLAQLPLFAVVASEIDLALLNEGDDQRQIEAWHVSGQVVSLVANTSRLPTLVQGQPSSHVLVFDDISALLSAQRAKTWSDMARRLAHEIKNPLTPIQLSAERLQRRLTGKLETTDQELLEKSCDTIVDQVAGLKAMVDEFRNYARLPMAKPEALELGGLVAEIMTLYATDARVQADLSGAACWVWADRGQLIQVIHNLVQNAQDAVADQTNGLVTLTTFIRATDGSGSEVVLRVDDNGPGIPPEMMSRVFEPYVTSKAKGSGLGLAIVKKIAEENRARISLETRRDVDQSVLGARAELSFAQWLPKAENLIHG